MPSSMKVAKTMKKSKAMKVATSKLAMKTSKNFDQAIKKTKAMKKEGTMNSKAMKKNSAMKTTAMKGTKPMKTKAMEDTKSMKKPAHAMTDKKPGSKPMPDLEPKWLLHHLALKCATNDCPSWVWLRKTDQLSHCSLCGLQWSKSYHQMGCHLRN